MIGMEEKNPSVLVIQLKKFSDRLEKLKHEQNCKASSLT